MNCIPNPDIPDQVTPEGKTFHDYPVINTTRVKDVDEKIWDCSFVLDHWDLYEHEREDPVLVTHISSAMVGSAYTNSSPALTLRQLFRMWHKGYLVYPAWYEKTRHVVHEPLFMVGMGGSVLSGSYLLWGVVPSRNVIVIADQMPEGGPHVIETIRLYSRIVNEG